MSLKEKISEDLLSAMKARESTRVGVLRMMKSAIRNREIERRGELGKEEILKVLSGLVKQRREAIEQFQKGNREDLVKKESDEIEVIDEYLPEAVSEEEIERVIEQTIQSLGAKSLKDMGGVMKAAMARFSGKPVDGKRVSEGVRKRLGGT